MSFKLWLEILVFCFEYASARSDIFSPPMKKELSFSVSLYQLIKAFIVSSERSKEAGSNPLCLAMKKSDKASVYFGES